MGANTPKVSVLILNYNYARFLPEAIESVLAQDLPPQDMEILVVDDGSTDDSREAVGPYLGRVRWIGKENGGQISAFNLGFEESRGEFVGLLEADDLWKKSKLRRCLERLEAEPRAALVQHWLLQADAAKNPLPGYRYPPFSDRYDFSEVIWGRIPLAGTSAIVFRKERIRPFVPMPPLLFGADICLRAAAAARTPLLNIPEILGLRRLHGGNLFGETTFDAPAKLDRSLAIHRGLCGFLSGVMAQEGIPPDTALLRRQEIDGFQLELFAARYHGRIFEALGAWTRVLRASGWRGHTVFKGATLLMALISPAIYVSLQGGYTRFLRSRAFPVDKAAGSGARPLESPLFSRSRFYFNWLLNGAARLKGLMSAFSLARPLVVSQGGVGDLILLTPLLEALAAGRPRSVDVLAAPGAAAVLENNPWIGRIFPFAPTAAPPRELLRDLNAAGYTAVFAAPVTLMTGLLLRYGLLGRHGRWFSDSLFGTWFPLSRLWAKQSVSYRRRIYSRHLAEIWLDMPPASSIQRPASPSPKVYPSPADARKAREIEAGLKGSPFVIVHVGGRDPIRRLPPETLIEVVKGIEGAAVLVGAGPEDAALARQVSSAAPKAVDLVGKLEILELYCLLEAASACIAPDSGIMHLAACAGVPLVALMGNQRPAHTGPISRGRVVVLDRDPSCSPCLRRTCDVFAGGSCIQSFQAAEILAALAEVMDQPRAGSSSR